LERHCPPVDPLDCKADLLVYGMGERNIVEIANRLATGRTVKDLRDLRGVAYHLVCARRRIWPLAA